jgi:hypothetical protein
MAVGLKVTGLRETVSALKSVGVSTDDLKEAWAPIGRDVVSKAKQVAPKRSGKMAGNIRTSRRQNGVIVSVGGASVPYASFVYFGSVHNPRPVPFIAQAMDAVDLGNEVQDAINRILARNGF